MRGKLIGAVLIVLILAGRGTREAYTVGGWAGLTGYLTGMALLVALAYGLITAIEAGWTKLTDKPQ